MSADLTSIHHDGPPDSAAQQRVAERGLELRVVPEQDRAAFAGWIDAVARGFLDPERTAVQQDAAFDRLAYRRKIGVFDATAPEPETAVATFASWMADLTVPAAEGGVAIPAVAISSVTVAPTHRRRGLARSMMEGELRWAASLGVAVAVLTVSESTLYGRYGFAPAASAANWRIESKRAGWVGPTAPGRVDFISRERWRETAAALHERVRAGMPGEIEMPGGHWDRFAATRPDADTPIKARAVQYTDSEGIVRGAALYSVEENHDDETKSTVTIAHLSTENDEAYAGLWRFFLEMDLIGEIRASELSVDEPLLWMIADQRAAKVTVTDHQYVRVLDVPSALRARSYSAPGTFALEVADPLGIGGGRWLLHVDEHGQARVEAWTDDAPAGAVTVRLGTPELSAAYLGGVSLATLAAAGRVMSSDVAAVARAFSWHRAPRLSFWY